MGESLERVQNKFACIIGELCNEPVVLSKFAIWLDLRLAEYKAKGAISLDCSGESPDPVWLKGHEKPEPVVYKTENHSYRSGNVVTHDIFNYDSNTTQPQGPQVTDFGLNSDIMKDINERLSPEIVVVKEEVPDRCMSNSENIYPVGLHVHDHKTRKRPSADILPTSTKSQRHMEDSSSNPAQSGTQSLMSIIGENRDDNDESLSQSRGDNSMTLMPNSSIADQSYSQASISSPDESSSSQNYTSFQPQIDQSFSPNQSRQNAAANESDMDLQNVVIGSHSKRSRRSADRRNELDSWPFTVRLNWGEIPRGAREQLEAGNPLEGRERLSFVRSIIDQLNAVYENPRKKHIGVIARRIYEKYPNSFVDKNNDPNTDSGYEKFYNQLRCRNENIHRVGFTRW